MNFPNASPVVSDLFNQLISMGQMINVYSDAYAEENQASWDISKAILAEYDERYGESYRNAFLVFFNDGTNRTVELLIKAYPAIAEIFDEDKIAPNFIFINLDLRQFRYIGVARKGNVYQATFGLDGTKITESIDDFEEIDYLSVFEEIYSALSSIAESNYNLCSGEIDEGLLADALEMGPDEDGFYFYGDEEEGLTLEEIEEKQRYFEDLGDDIEDGLHTLACYFPRADIGLENFSFND